jgi:hypothetical protein
MTALVHTVPHPHILSLVRNTYIANELTLNMYTCHSLVPSIPCHTTLFYGAVQIDKISNSGTAMLELTPTVVLAVSF